MRALLRLREVAVWPASNAGIIRDRARSVDAAFPAVSSMPPIGSVKAGSNRVVMPVQERDYRLGAPHRSLDALVKP